MAAVLVGINYFAFPYGAHNRGHPSNPIIYTTSHSLDEDLPLVWLLTAHFAWLRISFIPHYCTIFTFNLPSQFVLKIECFLYVFMGKKSRNSVKFLSLNLSRSPTSCKYSQLHANDFESLTWMFWVCWLSPAQNNVDFSQLMSQFDCYQIQLVYLTVEHYLAQNLQHEISPVSFNTLDQSEHLSIHGTNLFFFFRHSLDTLPFLNNKV